MVTGGLLHIANSLERFFLNFFFVSLDCIFSPTKFSIAASKILEGMK